MTITIYLFVLAIFISGVFYLAASKKKLSDEQLLEFEKKIKLTLYKFRILAVIPPLVMALLLLNNSMSFHLNYFLLFGLATLIVNIISYFGMKKMISKSSNASAFQFVLNYCLILGVGLLVLVFAAAYSLKDYLDY